MATTEEQDNQWSFPMAGWTKVEGAIDCLLDLVIIVYHDTCSPLLLLYCIFDCMQFIHKIHNKNTWMARVRDDGMGWVGMDDPP